MRELITPEKRIVKLEQQPDFPKRDLTENNTDMLGFTLASEEGVKAQGDYLKPYQGYIHLIADYALKMTGTKTRYSEDELASFSQGFASFEAINMMVHPPRLYDEHVARRKTQKLLQSSESTTVIPELELAERQSRWPHIMPNTYGVIVELGAVRHETMEQIHARTAGAHIAYQLATDKFD